jgi:hypothetical protein
MTILVAIETVLLVLALLLIVGLLRSHAEILRRLAAVEGGGRVTREPAATGEAASDISGETPWGDSVKLSLQTAVEPTLLAFLSTGCGACGALWDGLHGGAPVDGARVVVVTQGTDAESRPLVRELAPAGAEVVMSSDAWRSYGIPGSPHFVLVEGGRIAGQGAASAWEQIGALVRQARADVADGAHTTSDRAARAEEALAAAGIEPGHPSLYGLGVTEPPQ